MPTLNRNSFATVEVAIPSLDEQREVVEILDMNDRKIKLHQKKRMMLSGLLRALLHKLMTGEVRVSDLDLSALPPKPKLSEAAA